MELEDYKNLISLKPKPKNKSILKFSEKVKILDRLLEILDTKFEVGVDFSANFETKRRWLRAILNQTQPTNFGDEFFELQDKLLSSETLEKGVVHANDLDFKKNIAIFQGDITKIEADAIVNAGNSGLLGCFVPLHPCIDNIILSAGGFQIRNDLFKIMQKQGHDEENGQAKITLAYNLPCKFIIHTVGPFVDGALKNKDIVDLSNCYTSSLNLAKEMGLKTIVFCCISTGFFMFPNDRAAEIAVRTVKNWLDETGYDIKVVFDVFKETDKECYERELQK